MVLNFCNTPTMRFPVAVLATILLFFLFESDAFPHLHASENVTIGPRTNDELLRQASDLSRHVRERDYAARLLLDLENDAFSLFISGLSGGKTEIRQTSAVLLGRLGMPEAIDPLLSTMNGKDFITALSAERAIVNILQHLPPEDYTKISQEKVSQLAGKPGQFPFVRCLLNAAAERQQPLKDYDQSLAAEALSRRESASLRGAAARALAFSTHPEAAGALLLKRVPDEKDESVLIAICKTLIHLKPSENSDAVEPLARSDNQMLLTEAAGALFAMGYENMRFGLEKISREADVSAKVRALQILAEFHDPQSLGAVLSACSDSEWQVKIAAIKALGQFSNPSCTEQLQTMLKDDTAAVRAEAAILMAKQGIAGSVWPMTDDLRNGDNAKRCEAARALGIMKEPNAVAALRDAVRDSDLELASRAVISLGQIATPEARNALKFASDTAMPPVADLARRTLQSMTGR